MLIYKQQEKQTTNCVLPPKQRKYYGCILCKEADVIPKEVLAII